MPKPESVFLVTWLYDGDGPTGNAFFWTLKEALEFVGSLHDMIFANVSELHGNGYQRRVLEFAPAGLKVGDPWSRGYPPEFVKLLLDQPYPSPLRSPWDKG